MAYGWWRCIYIYIYRDPDVVSLSLEGIKLLLLKVRTLHSRIQGSM